jgi:hypothetical protein
MNVVDTILQRIPRESARWRVFSLFQGYSFFTHVVAGVVPVLSCKQPSSGLLGLAGGY